MESNNIATTQPIFKRWLRRKIPLLMVLLLITALITTFFWQRIVITVESGQAAILFKRFSGTEIDRVYEEGLHIFSPLDDVYIYEVRKQVALHDFDVISNKGLTVHLSMAIRYRPEYDLLGILHQSIGPDYLQRVILPQIESVMRKQLGSYTAEQIYTNEAGLLTKAILTALDEVGRNYVEVEDIIIRSIILPKQMVTAIENKLKQQEHMKSYEFRMQTAEKEAERLEIEAKGIQTYHSIISESLSEPTLRLKGIEATNALAKSNNAKVVIIGSGKDGLPIILNTDTATPTETSTKNEKTSTDTGNANSFGKPAPKDAPQKGASGIQQ
ncbi:MAG: SPFH domain, Band 7 family protein [uncultured Thiotrichaceae bacterium]|uniref:SPFH domain, Band 7 family protein n=1 Tax=uncultured Thiotrichaceae bacterium TaxID=298394 RepID=A0A6S6UFA2_9GAMM|nr:MAG: SPFH domain, Band 7 family protein [uncultured Thiotrichaceae bacterium]